jgi:formimidoylglutamate deiminase
MVKFRLDWAWLAAGWAENVIITVTDGTITNVEEDGDTDDATRVSGFALPGLTSLHSHAFQRGMAGLTETRSASDDSFWTWRETMYRFLDQLTPDDVADIAAMAYVEMLERGFTSVAEFHYLHHDTIGRPYANRAAMAEAVAQAARLSGIGLTLLPTLYRFGGFGEAPAGPGQRRFINSVDDFAKLLDASAHAIRSLDNARLGVALHSLRAVAPEDIAAVVSLRPNAPVHIHAAEQEQEVAACLAWSGQRPIAWLLEHAPLDHNWCVIHATQMTALETAGLARSAVVAGLCPITEANLGDGIFPAVEFMAAGGRFGIGTDSNILISASEELRTLEYGQRLRDHRRARLAKTGNSVGETLYRHALAGGAQASGRRTGQIAVGYRADWIVLDADDATVAAGPRDTLIDRAVFSAPALPIASVWTSGLCVVSEGRHHHRDVVQKKFTHTQRRLASSR